jgi:FkbM family methyltransferase
MQRIAPTVASRLCNPVSSVAREFTVDFHGFAYRGHTNNRIDWCVFYLKNFASAEASLVRNVRNYYKRIGRPFVCLDVGADVGHLTLAMAGVADTVIAVEAMRGAFRRLEEKIEANALNHVRLFQGTLDDKAGVIELEVQSPSNFLASRKTSALTRGIFGVQSVKAVRGDDLLREQSLPSPQFIKIDARSDTVRALSGLSVTLAKTRPIILITFPPFTPGQSIDAEGLRSVLYSDVKLYAFHKSTATGTFSLGPFDPDASSILCIPEEIVRVAEMEGCKYRSHGLEVGAY